MGMTADLSPNQYLALCNDSNFIIRNVLPKSGRYTVEYDYSEQPNPVGEQPAVSDVLGSVSQKTGADSGGTSVQDSDSQSDATMPVRRAPEGQGERAVAEGDNSSCLNLAQRQAVGGRNNAIATQSQGGVGNQGKDGSHSGELRRDADLDSGRREQIQPISGKAQGTECPTCSTINETEHCEICLSLERARIAAQIKRRAYHLKMSSRRPIATIQHTTEGSRGD